MTAQERFIFTRNKLANAFFEELLKIAQSPAMSQAQRNILQGLPASSRAAARDNMMREVEHSLISNHGIEQTRNQLAQIPSNRGQSYVGPKAIAQANPQALATTGVAPSPLRPSQQVRKAPTAPLPTPTPKSFSPEQLQRARQQMSERAKNYTPKPTPTNMPSQAPSSSASKPAAPARMKLREMTAQERMAASPKMPSIAPPPKVPVQAPAPKPAGLGSKIMGAGRNALKFVTRGKFGEVDFEELIALYGEDLQKIAATLIRDPNDTLDRRTTRKLRKPNPRILPAPTPSGKLVS